MVDVFGEDDIFVVFEDDLGKKLDENNKKGKKEVVDLLMFIGVLSIGEKREFILGVIDFDDVGVKKVRVDDMER